MKDGFRVIDCEPHIMEPFDLFARRLPEPWRSQTRVVPDEHGWVGSGFRYALGGRWVPRHSTLIERQSLRRVPEDTHLTRAAQSGAPDVYLEGLDTLGVDVGVFMPTLAMLMIRMDGLDPRYAEAICRASNDHAAEFCSEDPSRLKFWALLPAHDAELAAKEARRAVQELGAVGCGMPLGSVNGNLLSDAFFEPLWAELSDLGVPLGLHSATPTALGLRDIDVVQYRYRGHRRAEGFQHAPIFMFSVHTAAAELILGGVLDQYPGLQIVFMESGGGWLPHYLGVLDERWETYKEELEYELPLAPSEYFKRQCYAVIEADEPLLAHMIEQLGDRNWVLSTDYPHHDCAFPDAVDEFLSIEKVATGSQRRILWDNPVEMLGLSADDLPSLDIPS